MPASTTINNTETTVYSGSVVHDYIIADMFGRSSMVHFPMEDTEAINQPIVLHGEAEYLDDDRDHVEQHSEFTGADIELYTPLKAINRIKARTVHVRPGLRHLDNLGQSHGKSIGNGKTTAILSFLAARADDNGNAPTGSEMGDALDDAAGIKNAIEYVAGQMDENEVDAGGRFAFLKSTEFYKLQASNDVFSVDYGGQANRQTIGGNSAVIKYLNFTIVNCGIGFGINYSSSANYPTRQGETDLAFDLTNVKGVLWQARSWALREQVLPTASVGWIEHLQVWQSLTRYHYGLKAISDDESPNSGPGSTGIWSISV